MRPSQDVLTEFYSLAELNAERRIKAVESIVNHEDVLTHRKYILERSVEGLTSSRDGVRLGYVTLFTELLKKCSKDYEFFMLEQIMKEKIESQGHDVGQYSVDIAKVLFMSAILKSGKYSSEENIKIIVDKLMAILKGSPLLKIFIYETISTQMINIKPDQFNQHYWKFFKSDKMSGELLWFISKLPLAHKKAIHKACKFLGPKGEWTFEAHHYESLITLLKESQPAWKSGVIEILSRIPKMYENVIEKYASSNESDQLKTLERYSLCIPAGIVNGKIPMNVIVSEKFIECIYKLSAFSGVTRKLVSVAIYQLLKQIHENVIARNSPAIEIVSIIKRCDEICKGSFDAITCPKHFVFTVEMMKSMKVEDIAGYYLGNVSVLKRVIASIKDEESSDKLGALFKLVLENRDTVNGTHVTNGISEMLSLVFLVRSERNQITKVELKESQKNVIADAYKYVSDEEFEGKSVVSTTVFKALKIIEAVTEDAEDLKAVEGIIEEIRSTTDQELTSGIFFDMLFTILGRQSKIFKLIGFYMFTAASVGFGIDEFQFMIETVTKSNEALLKGDDEENEEEDDEFKPITKEEREALKKMQAEVGGEEAEESEGEEGDSEDDEEDVDMDESEDEDEEIDEGYKNAIMEALGDAAQVNSDDEDIVFDDEAMFKIDGALAQAFKKHFGANKKQLNKELRSYGATFKGKVISLMEIQISHLIAGEHYDAIVSVINPLLELSNALVGTEETLAHDITKMIERIIEHSKNKNVSAEEIVDMKEDFMLIVQHVNNPEIKKTCGKISSFYGKVGGDTTNYLDEIKECLGTKNAKTLLAVILSKASKAPEEIVGIAPQLVQMAFEDLGNNKLFENNLLLEMAFLVLRKDLVNGKGVEENYTKLADAFVEFGAPMATLMEGNQKVKRSTFGETYKKFARSLSKFKLC